MSENSSYDDELQDMYREYGKETTHKILAKAAGYETVPPTIDEFVTDSEFLGDIYGFDKNSNHYTVYPYWMAALREVYPDPFNSPYFEIITTGATGQGKTLFSMIGALYDICKLLHVKNPQSKYTLASNNKMTFMLINANLKLSKGVLFQDMMSAIGQSPFFRKKMAMAGKYSIFENNIHVDYGSVYGHALGQAVFGAIISEINFQKNTASQAKDNYDGMMSRIRGRFQTDYAYPGHIFVDSSKTETGSFIEETLLKNRDLKAEGVKLFDNPRWEVLPPWKLPGDTFDKFFDVFKGNENKDPFVIERETQREGLHPGEILKVPHIYTSDFKKNIQKSLQDIAGVSTQAAHKFIPSVEVIDACFRQSSGDFISNPVTKEVIALDMRNEDDILIDYIDFDLIPKDSRPRFIHIDLAYADGGDRTGIASTRLDGISTIARLDSVTNKMVKVHEPIFYTDFVMAVEAKSGQEVPIYKLENFCVDLKARGYKIAMVTMDGFNSKYMLQNLALKGFVAELLSVDRAFEPYIEFKQAIMNDRWKCPFNPILNEELKKLEIVKGVKVDHPSGDGASKDLSDACCGSIFTAKAKMAELRANMTTADLSGALNNRLKPTNVYDSLLNSMGMFDPNRIK